MANDDQMPDRDCGTDFSSGIPRRVTKPKIYDEAMHIRLPAGTKQRIEKVRGKLRQADFIRQALLDELERLEGGSNKPDKQTS
jgi:hypothetical protein